MNTRAGRGPATERWDVPFFGRSSRRTRRGVWLVLLLTAASTLAFGHWRSRRPARATDSHSAPYVPSAQAGGQGLRTEDSRFRRDVDPHTEADAPDRGPADPPALSARAGPVLTDLRAGASGAGRADVTHAAPNPGPWGTVYPPVAARRVDEMLFGPQIPADDALASRYTVRPGDSLERIARQFRVTADLLASVNELTDKHRLTAGRPLKVLHGPFQARIRKSEYRMEIQIGDTRVRTFRVGLGANDSTPTGRWIVREKIVNPAWTNPLTREHYLADDPENPIGEYWIGLDGVSGDAVGRRGFGIHGTVDPDTIGRQASLGCVRLRPGDIEQVYRLLVVGDSAVEIEP